MDIISHIFLVICIVMLLHITLTNLLFGIDLRHHGFKSGKFWLIKAAINFAVILIVLTINVLLKDTNYNFVSNLINGFVIGWIISNYYTKYL